MQVQRIQLGENHYSWLVLDDNYLPIKPIQEFIRYLDHTEKSPNTIRAYGFDRHIRRKVSFRNRVVNKLFLNQSYYFNAHNQGEKLSNYMQ